MTASTINAPEFRLSKKKGNSWHRKHDGQEACTFKWKALNPELALRNKGKVVAPLVYSQNFVP